MPLRVFAKITPNVPGLCLVAENTRPTLNFKTNMSSTKPTSNEAKNGNSSKPLLSSRLLKFRAWDFKNNKWLLGYEYPNLGGKKLSDLKLMQFTGILDINKKPIYEGDIVNDEELGKGIVVFQSGCFFMMYEADTNMEFLGLKTDRFGRLQEKRIVEILGNIYENENLL